MDSDSFVSFVKEKNNKKIIELNLKHYKYT